MINLEVECETGPQDELCVAGADASLGGWDLSLALKLNRNEATKWSVEVPIPAFGTEFKLVLLKVGGEPAWEPFPENRRFPTHGLGSGSVLRTQYGQPRMAVEASTSHIEANAKVFKKLEQRQGSALQSNVDQKGENAYYYAHTRKFEVPEHAKVITGPGLITGGQPLLLAMGAMEVDATEEERTVYLKDYSWADSNGKIKVYVPVPEGLLPAEGADSLVEASFEISQVDLTIKCKPRQRLRIEKLNGELKVEACTTRVEAHKNRVVLQLVKKRDTTWYSLTKK